MSMLRFVALLTGVIAVAISPTARAAPAPTPPPRARAAAPEPARCARLYQERRYRAAKVCFAKLAVGPRPDPVLLYALGYCHYQLAEYPAALQRFRAALRRQPQDGDTHFMLGVTLVKLRRFREALRTLRRAIALGMRSEAPDEARRYVHLLRTLLRTGPRPGLRWHVGAGAGFDSHPRLEGQASMAGTSDGSTAEGSGFAYADAGIGYRWRLGRLGWATVRYEFHQRLVFNDLSTTVLRQAGRFAVEPPELSLQRHHPGVSGRLVGSRWSAGIRVDGVVELSGLNRFTPSLAALPVVADGRVQWHRRTESRLSVGVGPQWALDPSLDYLDGTLLWLEAIQTLSWGRLAASARYRFSNAWLGTALQPASDCPHGEACLLSAPYRHQAHGAQLSLSVTATRWLRLSGSAGVTRRAYSEDSVFRIQGGRDLSIRRVDLTQRYDLGLDFLLTRGLTIRVSYAFTLNHSTITEQQTGLDEGYQRHLATLGVLYHR